MIVRDDDGCVNTPETQVLYKKSSVMRTWHRLWPNATSPVEYQAVVVEGHTDVMRHASGQSQSRCGVVVDQDWRRYLAMRD